MYIYVYYINTYNKYVSGKFKVLLLSIFDFLIYMYIAIHHMWYFLSQDLLYSTWSGTAALCFLISSKAMNFCFSARRSLSSYIFSFLWTQKIVTCKKYQSFSGVGVTIFEFGSGSYVRLLITTLALSVLPPVKLVWM